MSGTDGPPPHRPPHGGEPRPLPGQDSSIEHTVGQTVERTLAVVRRSRWPGWIWAIPIGAVGILIWLAVRFLFAHGETVTVLFDRVPGVNAQATQVTYRGVRIGVVKGVALTADGEHARLTLSLERSMDKYLRSGTRFWLEGVSTSLANLPSLSSIISGPTVAMEPGPGQPRHSFIGLELPPAFQTPTLGTPYELTAQAHGSVQTGSNVYYLGQPVGKVTSVQLAGPHRFRIEVLIRSPYDRFVHAASRFWDAGALEVSMTQGIKVQWLSLMSLIEGAIAFETPAQAAGTPPSAADSVFELYPDQSSAQLAPAGPYALYTVRFPGAVGKLEPGAPVKLRDFVVGEVRQVGFDFDARSGELASPVTIALEADRLHIVNAPGGPADPAQVVDQALARLVREGLRARLAEELPLLGPEYVALDLVPDAQPARLDLSAHPPVIPAVGGGGLSTVVTEMSQLPLQQIGANVRAVTARIRTLASSPKVTDSLTHLDRSLTAIDAMLRQARPQVGPIVTSLRRAAGQMDGVMVAARSAMGGTEEQGGLSQAMDEMTRAARSVRSLADYLERHPEALIRGKQP